MDGRALALARAFHTVFGIHIRLLRIFLFCLFAIVFSSFIFVRCCLYSLMMHRSPYDDRAFKWSISSHIVYSVHCDASSFTLLHFSECKWMVCVVQLVSRPKREFITRGVTNSLNKCESDGRCENYFVAAHGAIHIRRAMMARHYEKQKHKIQFNLTVPVRVSHHHHCVANSLFLLLLLCCCSFYVSPQPIYTINAANWPDNFCVFSRRAPNEMIAFYSLIYEQQHENERSKIIKNLLDKREHIYANCENPFGF